MTDLRKLLKNRNNRLVFVISIIGIVIILLSGVSPEDNAVNTGKGAKIGEEERLVEILQKIEGAGRVDVMITYEEKEKSGGIGYGDKEYIKAPKGVIIVADGADEPSVRLSLKEAATAVMGVGANRVCVYKRES